MTHPAGTLNCFLKASGISKKPNMGTLRIVKLPSSSSPPTRVLLSFVETAPEDEEGGKEDRAFTCEGARERLIASSFSATTTYTTNISFFSLLQLNSLTTAIKVDIVICPRDSKCFSISFQIYGSSLFALVTVF